MARSGLGHESFTATFSSPGVHTPGELIDDVDSEGRKCFKFVKYDNGTGNLTLAAGDVVYYLDGSDFDGYTVTKDVSDTDINQVAGIALSAIGDGEYGFIQTYGYKSNVATNADDDISASDSLIGVGDGTVDSVAQDTAPTNKVIGWATADDSDSDNTVDVFLTLEG